MSRAKTNQATLATFWTAVRALKPSSTDDEFDKIAAFFTEDAVAYLSGMAAPPSEGRAGIIAGFKALVQIWAMGELRVLSSGASEDGRFVMQDMDNDLLILGEPVPNFKEAEFVEFDDAGLIKNYRLYADSTPVMQVLIKKGVMPAPKFD